MLIAMNLPMQCALSLLHAHAMLLCIYSAGEVVPSRSMQWWGIITTYVYIVWYFGILDYLKAQRCPIIQWSLDPLSHCEADDKVAAKAEAKKRPKIKKKYSGLSKEDARRMEFHFRMFFVFRRFFKDPCHWSKKLCETSCDSSCFFLPAESEFLWVRKGNMISWRSSNLTWLFLVFLYLTMDRSKDIQRKLHRRRQKRRKKSAGRWENVERIVWSKWTKMELSRELLRVWNTAKLGKRVNWFKKWVFQEQVCIRSISGAPLLP